MRISDWSSDVCSSDLKTSFDLGFHDFDAFRAGLQNGRLRRVIGGRVRFVAAGYKWFYPAALKPSKTAGVDHAPAFSIRPSTQASPNERAMSYSTNEPMTLKVVPSSLLISRSCLSPFGCKRDRKSTRLNSLH